MKKFYWAVVLGLGLMASLPVYAQNADGVESFKQDRDSWRRKNDASNKAKITPKMRDLVQAQALRNITEAEQAFCYTVGGAAPDFAGYTIDGMEITGFCGILSRPEIDLFIEEFLSKDENISNVVERCIIQPRIMLRFVRGVDFTDILFSSPCHSFTAFYAGKIKTFNTSPSAKIVDAIVNAYEQKKMNFVSPALLQQVLPIGIPQNDEQRALVKEKSVQQPIRNWKVEEPQKKREPESSSPKGWNRLKINNKN